MSPVPEQVELEWLRMGSSSVRCRDCKKLATWWLIELSVPGKIKASVCDAHLPDDGHRRSEVHKRRR